jgi:hypothetical protein
MKAIWGLAALGMLTGCHSLNPDPPEIAQCEKYILAKLKAPGTYKRNEASSLGIPFQKPTYWMVGIDYSSADTGSAPAPGGQVCTFPLANGRPDTSKYIDFDRQSFQR